MPHTVKNNQLIEDYLSESDWRVKENANMGYSLQGLNSHLSSTLTKDYWLHKLYPEPVRNAHLSGAMHIHDLGSLSVYCCGWDIRDLLLKGFSGAYGKVESAPAKHFRTALGQIYNFLYTMAGEAAGAEAFSSFDTYLAPFVHNDGLSYEEVKQAMQEFVFNMNVPTRVGFQTPFTNITMDLQCAKHLEDESVIIGGHYHLNWSYGLFQEEMDMINRAFCEVMMEGDAAGRIFSFPIPTYNITKDFDWDNPQLDLLWEMTAKYGIPYFSNFINSDMSPEDARSMCCRLRLDNRELHKRGGGLFGANPLTGSVGVVTINLAQAAYQAEDCEQLHEAITDLMWAATDSLEIKRQKLEEYTEMGLYPFSKFYLSGVKERANSYWANHFSTIGLIGMNEACVNLLGEGISTAKGKALAELTLNVMRDVLLKIQEATGNIYNLEATPAEGTSYRLAKLDKKNFPGIFTAGTDEVPYYTNSTQLPVDATRDIFEALMHQDSLQTLYTGGTVFHGFLGERIDDPTLARDLVRQVASNFKLPYFTATPTFSVCPVHKYISGEHFDCPTCGKQTEVYSRVVGFHRPTKQWNVGKQAEFGNRAEFDLEGSMHFPE